ncbi:MAG: helix-turn-helix transcriptional regulator [Planctomycetaceae bacterium]|nr:helix-turn-helix transcriptional regulator [Planctomycetaceae bacterium]
MKNRIREHRARLQMNQETVAQHIGIARPSLSAIENGKFVPSTELALRLARLFGVPVEQIFSLEDEQ